MKDSFGGTYMLYILLVFFVIFVCLLATTVNLSKIFRVKNIAINYLEHDTYDDAIIKIEDISGYVIADDTKAREHCIVDNNGEMVNGVCIVEVNQSLGVYYKVFSYIVMDFPFFDTGILIPIGGETKTIVN